MSGLSALDLRVEHLAEPGGLNTETPRFSWALASERMGANQTAWRIRVFEVTRGGETLLWDSGRVASPQSRHVPYAGPPLPRDAVLTWQLSVWDETGTLSDARPPAPIFTGLRREDWAGQWIARYFVLPAGREVPADTIYDNRWQARPADYVRRSFAVADRPVRALLYISALGLYEPWLNGQRVGEDVLAPGWTDYHTRVEYQVHDVTDHVVAGENVIGAILGEGWYSGRVGHNQRRAGNHYGGRPALICALHLHHADGRVEIIASDDQWQTRQGPICYSDFLMGEMYDARLALEGWSERPGRLDGWQPVECFMPDPRPPLLDAARAQPVREIARLEARFLRFSASGAALFDLGQNIAGYCALSVSAPAGARFVLRHGEILDGAGELYVANLRHAVATDIFIAAGQGEERFCPRFTFHGFRYVELTLPDGLTPEDVQLSGIAISTATPQTGTLRFEHEMLDRLVSNINWSQRDNFIAVPTDCPQRDERYGWTADAQVFWKTAGYFADCSAFLAKWMLDIADGQSAEGAFPDVAPTKPLNPYRLTPQPGAPGWGDAPIILAWEHWLRHADRELIESYYPAFERWMAHIGAPNPDFLRRNAVYNNYGDWLSVGPASDRTLVATAYWYRIAHLMEKLASVLGRMSDAARYRQLANAIGDAFRREFLGPDGRLLGDTQTAYLLALDFGLLSGPDRDRAADRLVALITAADGHLQTGFLGVRHLCPVLSSIGRDDLAIDLLLKDSYPSWGFSIRHGATTIWERWDGWTPERGFQSANMNSFNHYAYGSVGEWLWSRLAGIDATEAAPGYRVIALSPWFEPRIGQCEARYRSTRGLVESRWQCGAEGTVSWSVLLPPGTEGQVSLPPNFRLADSAAAMPERLVSGRHEFQLVPR